MYFRHTTFDIAVYRDDIAKSPLFAARTCPQRARSSPLNLEGDCRV
jgi:hypothetical protein